MRDRCGCIPFFLGEAPVEKVSEQARMRCYASDEHLAPPFTTASMVVRTQSKISPPACNAPSLSICCADCNAECLDRRLVCLPSGSYCKLWIEFAPSAAWSCTELSVKLCNSQTTGSDGSYRLALNWTVAGRFFDTYPARTIQNAG
jgi:hypothetical protein